jgi:hypothetical protein
MERPSVRRSILVWLRALGTDTVPTSLAICCLAEFRRGEVGHKTESLGTVAVARGLPMKALFRDCIVLVQHGLDAASSKNFVVVSRRLRNSVNFIICLVVRQTCYS